MHAKISSQLVIVCTRARLVCGAAPLHWTGLDRHGRSGRLRTAGTMSVPVRSRDEAAAAIIDDQLSSVVHPGGFVSRACWGWIGLIRCRV